MPKAPTLTDIRNLISANHAEVQIRLGAVEEQVRLTNGRVKALETAEAVAQGIADYKATQEAQSGSNPKVDWSKYFWIAVALAAALVAIGQALGVSK